MNPCPCGNKGNKQKQCICKPSDLDRYKRKLSGPIMDRIDIWVNVTNVDYEKLSNNIKEGEQTKTIKDRVLKAREIQTKRFKNSIKKISSNSEMNVKDLSMFAPLTNEIKQLLNESAERLQLSARAYHRTIKLARTIADLGGCENITASHILEAIQYRPREN